MGNAVHIQQLDPVRRHQSITLTAQPIETRKSIVVPALQMMSRPQNGDAIVHSQYESPRLSVRSMGGPVMHTNPIVPIASVESGGLSPAEVANWISQLPFAILPGNMRDDLVRA